MYLVLYFLLIIWIGITSNIFSDSVLKSGEDTLKYQIDDLSCKCTGLYGKLTPILHQIKDLSKKCAGLDNKLIQIEKSVYNNKDLTIQVEKLSSAVEVLNRAINKK